MLGRNISFERLYKGRRANLNNRSLLAFDRFKIFIAKFHAWDSDLSLFDPPLSFNPLSLSGMASTTTSWLIKFAICMLDQNFLCEIFRPHSEKWLDRVPDDKSLFSLSKNKLRLRKWRWSSIQSGWQFSLIFDRHFESRTFVMGENIRRTEFWNTILFSSLQVTSHVQ